MGGAGFCVIHHSFLVSVAAKLNISRQLGEEAKRAGIRGLCSKCDVRFLLKAVEALLRDKPISIGTLPRPDFHSMVSLQCG
jgi:hypothetical protein